MALVDANYSFITIDVGCNGRVSDGGVFSRYGRPSYIKLSIYIYVCIFLSLVFRTALSNGLENNSLGLPPPSTLPGRCLAVPYVAVADDAFPLRKNIMKPYPFRNQHGVIRIFNYRLSRARRLVENAFALLANVFRVFRKPILLDASKTETIILASCTLHNYLLKRKRSNKIYAPQGTFDFEDDDGTLQQGSWRTESMPSGNFLNISRQGSNFYAESAADVREEFKNYFISETGEVPWQYRYC